MLHAYVLRAVCCVLCVHATTYEYDIVMCISFVRHHIHVWKQHLAHELAPACVHCMTHYWLSCWHPQHHSMNLRNALFGPIACVCRFFPQIQKTVSSCCTWACIVTVLHHLLTPGHAVLGSLQTCVLTHKQHAPFVGVCRRAQGRFF